MFHRLLNLGTMPKLAPKMILIVGGSSDSLEHGALSTCELFSIPDLCPLPKCPPMNLARRAPALFQFKNGVFVVGGCSAPGNHLNSAEFIQFDEEGEQWKGWKMCDGMDPSPPNAFSCASFCQTLDGTAFVFGGFDGCHCLRQSLLIGGHQSMSSLPYPTTVRPINPLPYALKNGVAVETVNKCCGDKQAPLIGEQQAPNSRIWLVGGWDGHRTLKTIFEYSLSDGNCSLKQLLPYPIEGHSVAVSSSPMAPQRAFISGGFDGIELRPDILVLDLQSGAIEPVDGVGLNTPRENHCSVIFGDGHGSEWLAIIGGWDGHKALSDWELFELLPHAPWVQRADKGPWGETTAVHLGTARNRAGAVPIY